MVNLRQSSTKGYQIMDKEHTPSQSKQRGLAWKGQCPGKWTVLREGQALIWEFLFFFDRGIWRLEGILLSSPLIGATYTGLLFIPEIR